MAGRQESIPGIRSKAVVVREGDLRPKVVAIGGNEETLQEVQGIVEENLDAGQTAEVESLDGDTTYGLANWDDELVVTDY